MTNDEKAKAYDEALKKIQPLYEQAKKDGNPIWSTYEYLFPELHKSEDERARKAALEGIEYLERKLGWDAIGDTDILDVKEYLEKQKEQPISAEEVLARAGLKPYKDGNQWCILAGDNIQEGICGFGDTIEDALYEFLKEVLDLQKGLKEISLIGGYAGLYFDEWNRQKNPTKRQCFMEGMRHARGLQKEQKSAEKQDYSGLNDLEKAIHRGFLSAGVENVPVTIIKETAKECLEQMKPAGWSKNDTVFLNEITDFFENKTVRLQHDIDMYAHWLKSLPERFVLQSKQEWSEEDEKKIIFLERLIEHNVPDGQYSWADGRKCGFVTKSEAISMLKSLRPSWKPSEEQMTALDGCLKHWTGNKCQKEFLESLYEQLKKL